ncbi:glycine cleavage system aminomethyltransferase GcvT [Aliivibrio sp. S4TY2]|uniref:glycine cleavage system aminomethyltransferase GcvT n=1 Tax=unclassified Aliivibrio TaxID=2645654 RepID=UPI002378ED44|nr:MULTISPECIES: glycine cleavage system aminomethyltransferase GcvT [unclassified Aliivibrio]MDD9156401.1 glycine cleavage system aminomethyltransferase GcvT [Aliivibrio sp. S4TY2]MDD9162331.1 glycine cleavage system aminomethyltransferase GcvT [Aliivibrio sp. S4TY1]MDD9164109.1 glycine cleavage system aminomethyltransferase GcvT [Aliivibrio sp. S4MY2]MDD9167918.1 glycine cleavage system aminomethyltransferase GcvT [Aliivibrio sp. S4MY4]MDD9187417.1 glycine cleavage system aminomethyltransfer
MSEQLNKTALFDMHVVAGAKMVPFAGYEMPVQYPLGVKKEHLHTRNAAGLFDVSHMGQLRLKGEGAAAALEALVPVDIIDLPSKKQRYAFFTNDAGGIMDDLMVANFGDHLFVVVNAACKEQDIAHLQANLPEGVELEVIEDRALLALQGPQAADVLSRLQPSVASMLFMDTAVIEINGIECYISRSGYTGEDGYEISVPNDKAEMLATALTSFEEVEWIGLGARDSLRLECGLCLYGHDLDTTTTPVEASLLWGISKNRRSNGERAGGFPGADIILKQIETKDVNRKRVGLVGQSKAPVREGCKLFDAADNEIGIVTSGTAGPTAGKPVSMGYVRADLAIIGTELFAEVRGKKLAMNVEKMPFVPQRYYRG